MTLAGLRDLLMNRAGACLARACSHGTLSFHGIAAASVWVTASQDPAITRVQLPFPALHLWRPLLRPHYILTMLPLLHTHYVLCLCCTIQFSQLSEVLDHLSFADEETET